MVGLVSVVGGTAETAVYEEMGTKGDCEGGDYGALFCEFGGGWVGLYVREEG